jgi:hypothetical protein
MTTFIALGTLILQVFGMKVRSKLAQGRRLFDAAALTEPPFVRYSGFLLLGFVGLYIPFFYVQVYSLQGGFVCEVRT